MGLPSYIINFDELKQPIIDAINEASIEVEVGDISLDSASVKVDTSAIEDILDDVVSKLGSVADNTILVKDTTNQILNQLLIHDINLTDKLSSISVKIEDIVTSMTSMYELLEKIKDQLATDGQQRIVGEVIVVPSLSGTYNKTLIFDKDIVLTGFTMSQSAWNFTDRWTLDVGAFTMFDRIATKLRGEHKRLEKFLPVPANTPIIFKYDNNGSSNSKYVWIDLEFIEVDATPVTPENPTPPETTTP